jgi:hypothetical protein
MQLMELLREITAVAQTGGSAANCEALARETEALADMVGWATGPIDPEGQWMDRLMALQGDLKVLYDQTRDPAVALLHDALTDLGRAIARHDEDLDTSRTEDDDNEPG